VVFIGQKKEFKFSLKYQPQDLDASQKILDFAAKSQL
jgi:hypothetical protein